MCSNDCKQYEQYFLDEELEIIYAKAEVQPNEKAKGSIVFCHGVCHGAWCWKFYLPYFSEKGYDCFAFSLRGHGESKGGAKSYKLSDYEDDLKRVVEHCTEKTGRKPFVLGHSMGGAIVQKYIDEYSEQVRAAILFAPVTAGGMWRGEGRRIPLIKNDWYTFPTMRGKFNENLKDSNFFVAKYHDTGNYECRITDPEELREYNKKLCKESWKAVWGLMRYSLKNLVGIPVFVIGTATDAYFPRESLGKTADFYHTKAFVLEGMCHDMMLDPDKELAARAVLEFMDRSNELKNDPERFGGDLEELIESLKRKGKS